MCHYAGFYTFPLCHVLAGCMLLWTGCIMGQQSQGASLDVEAFNQFGDAKKRELLLESQQQWLEKTNNLRIVTHSCTYCVQIEKNMVPKSGAPKEFYQEVLVEYSHIKNSYRAETKWWAHGDYEKKMPSTEETGGYDSELGVWRGVGNTLSMKKSGTKQGRITTRHSPLFGLMYRYGRLLDGDYIDETEYLIPYLIKYQHEIKFEHSSRPGEIQVVLKNRLYGEQEPCGLRHMWFDPVHDMRLTHMECDYKRRLGKTDFWYRQNLDIPKYRHENGIWLPDKIVEVLMGSAYEPGMGSVFETTLLEADVGKVTKKDLEITFPPKTYVNDDIQGKQYRIGEDGKQIPYGKFGETSDLGDRQRVKGNSRPWILAGTSMALVCLIVILIVRRRRRS